MHDDTETDKVCLMQERVPNLPGLGVGHIVAVQTSTTAEAPWLGKCTKVGDDTLEVIWMEGGWKKPWKQMMLRQGRGFVEWRDTVSKDTVILYDIELTKTGRLKAATVTYLKEQYSKVCSKNHSMIL